MTERELLAESLDLLNLLVDKNLCEPDSEGNCPIHGWYTFGRSECAQARSRRLLAEQAEVWLT